jgi:hypothetical protein
MVQQIRPRLVPSFLGAVLLAATLSCIGSDRRKFTQFGEDVLVIGSMPPNDSVTGDVILAGGDVEFHGSAGGDYVGVGGSQVVGGRIHGSIRAAGGNVNVTGVADRNATVAGGNVSLDSTGIIARNAYFTGGNVQVNGTVNGGLLASGGAVTLNGIVGRDVEISSGDLTIGPRAQIMGNLRYRVPAKNVHIDRAARITGTVTAVPARGGLTLWRVLWLLGTLVAGAVIVALFPRFMAGAAATLAERPVKSGIVGVCWGFLVPIVIVLAAVTRIGIPLALVASAVYLIVLFIGGIPFSLWLGQRILGARPPSGLLRVLVAFLIGGAILQLVELIPVVGPVLALVAGTIGAGAIVLRAWASRRESAVLASV